MIIGKFSTSFLHARESPTGVASLILYLKGSIFISQGFAYVVETNECLAPESNSVHARLPYKGMVPVTTITSST